MVTKFKEIYILIIILSILSIYDIQWYYDDTSPPTWDDSWHLMSSLSYYNIIKHPHSGMIDELVHVDGYYPPLFKISTAFLYMIFGTSIVTALSTNIIYIIIFAVSIYGIGKIFFDAKVGLFASILVLLYPMIFNMQKLYYLDLSLASLVTLSIYVLLLTNTFRNFRYSIYFGVAFSLAILVKWTAVIFIAPTVAYVILDKILEKQLNKKLSEKYYYIYSLIVTGSISSIWYIPNGVGVYNEIKTMSDEWAVRSGVDPNIMSYDSISFYPIAIVSIISIFLTAIFVIGLLYSIYIFTNMINRYKIKNIIFLFIWMIVPVVILIAEPNKNVRYIFPALGSIAIISSYWIFNISNIKIKYMTIIVILVVCTVQIVQVAAINPPNKEDWKHDIILSEIMKNTLEDKIDENNVSVIVIPDHEFINGRTFQYFAFKNNMSFNITNGGYVSIDYFKSNLLNFTYIIIKSGDLPNSYLDIVKPEYDFFLDNMEYFNKTFESSLPDNTSIILYKRNGSKEQKGQKEKNTVVYMPKMYIEEPITLASPTDTTSWYTGVIQNITWTGTGITGNVRIHLFKNHSWQNTIAEVPYDQGSYSWHIPSMLAEATDYHIKIEMSSDTSKWNWETWEVFFNITSINLTSKY